MLVIIFCRFIFKEEKAYKRVSLNQELINALTLNLKW